MSDTWFTPYSGLIVNILPGANGLEPGSTPHLSLWRAVDQERLPHERSERCGYGEVVDVYLQARRDGAAAKRFFKRLIKSHGDEPRKIVTDKLRSNGAAHRELMPDVFHDASQYANNLAEQSHEPTRVRERVMRWFKSTIPGEMLPFLGAHAAVYNLFNLGRHLVSANPWCLSIIIEISGQMRFQNGMGRFPAECDRNVPGPDF